MSLVKNKISDFSIKQKLKQISNMDKDKALRIVAVAKIKPDTERNKIFIELQSEIKKKTSNFANVDSLSSEKFDMEPVVEEQKLDKQLYLSHFGSFQRSEIDVLKTLAANLANEKEVEDVKSEDKTKRIRIAKAKVKILLLLQLQNSQN